MDAVAMINKYFTTVIFSIEKMINSVGEVRICIYWSLPIFIPIMQ